MLKKIGIFSCILFFIILIFTFTLENQVILLSRQHFTLPTEVAAEDAYTYVLTYAETDQYAIPFYLSIDFDPYEFSLSFSLYSYTQLGIEDLYYIYTYDYCNGSVTKSQYIGSSLNLKEWVPHLYLSDDFNFHANTIALFSEVLSIIEINAEPSFRFPVIYCDSRLFDTSGLIYSGK